MTARNSRSLDTAQFTSPRYNQRLQLLGNNQVFLAAATVAEPRYGSLVAGWGVSRCSRLEASIQATMVVPVTNYLLTLVADLRFACRRGGKSAWIGLLGLALIALVAVVALVAKRVVTSIDLPSVRAAVAGGS